MPLRSVGFKRSEHEAQGVNPPPLPAEGVMPSFAKSRSGQPDPAQSKWGLKLGPFLVEKIVSGIGHSKR